MDNNNSKPGDANNKHLSHNRYKPVKRHSLETDNTLVKVLESLVYGLSNLWESVHIFAVILIVEH